MGGEATTRRGFLRQAGAGLALSAAAVGRGERVRPANLVIVRAAGYVALDNTDVAHLVLRGVDLSNLPNRDRRGVTVCGLAEGLHEAGYRVGHFAGCEPSAEGDLAEAASQFVRENRNRPFLLDYRVSAHGGAASGVERLLGTLRELGLAGDTVVIVLGRGRAERKPPCAETSLSGS